VPSPENQLARILWLAGDPSGFSLLPQLRDNLDHWPEPDPSPKSPLGQPYVDPEDAAHALLVGLDGNRALDLVRSDLYAWDPAALSALDSELVCTPEERLFNPFWDHGRYELPALLATCAVRHTSRSEARIGWRAADALLDRRLISDSHDGALPTDPWWVTWRLLDQGYPLGAIYEMLSSRRSVPAAIERERPMTP